MRVAIAKLIMGAAIAALVAAGGGSVAWGQSLPPCPASPDYSASFALDQTCMTLNGNAAFLAPAELAPVVLRLTANAGNQVASAWFNTAQNVQGGFSTSFQFQFTNPSTPWADGIAFVIQNSSTAAIGFTGGNGGALGYGDRDGSTNPSTGEGIPNSLAIEFDTYKNGWDPAAGPTGSVSHVAVQSCGLGPNTSHHNEYCNGDGGLNSTLGAPVGVANLADGAVHTVSISYTPPAPSCIDLCVGSLHVILDDVDIYPGGVSVDLASIGLGEGGTAYVGFTGATGAAFEDQDILTWTYTPQSESAPVTTDTTTVFSFQGGVDNGGYDYTAKLTSGDTVTAQVTPVVFPDQTTCNGIVQANELFHGAQCFVYQNANGTGTTAAVMFELTCPGSPGGTCGSDAAQNFFADLGTDFNFALADNPEFVKTNPTPGWLKGVGPDPLHPCTQYPGNNPPLFQSNQISSFLIVGDPKGTAKGSSGGTGSCWLATYNTPNENPSVNIVSPANGGTYLQGQATQANYTCTTVNNTPSATGPYLTQASCTATDTPGGSVAQGAQFDTATVGPHTFVATVVDSATDTASQTVTYNVVGSPDLSVVKTGPARAYSGNTVKYRIKVTNLGSADAVNASVDDTLPSGTVFLSVSGGTTNCSIIKGRVVCKTVKPACTFAGSTVSCSLGTVMPFSSNSKNGALIDIQVQVTAPGGTKTNPVVISNTATVSSESDSNANNNSSTVATVVVKQIIK